MNANYTICGTVQSNQTISITSFMGSIYIDILPIIYISLSLQKICCNVDKLSKIVQVIIYFNNNYMENITLIKTPNIVPKLDPILICWFILITVYVILMAIGITISIVRENNFW